MNLEEILILEHVSNTGANGHFLPCLEGVLRILNGGIELVVSGLRDLANDLLGGLSTQLPSLKCLRGLSHRKLEDPWNRPTVRSRSSCTIKNKVSLCFLKRLIVDFVLPLTVLANLLLAA
jgi:hypothetical protein